MACLNENIPAVRFLLDSSAHVGGKFAKTSVCVYVCEWLRTKGGNGQDPLAAALSSGNAEIVQLLLDNDTTNLEWIYCFTGKELERVVLEHPRVQEICQVRGFTAHISLIMP